MNRRLWFQIHGWCSLPVWLIFTFVCLTGTIAVVSHELTWLTNPDARAWNPDNRPRQPVSALVAAVEEEVPGAAVSSVFYLEESWLVTAVSFAAPDIPNATAYVNPYTAEVQAINQSISFMEFMRALHGWLLFPWQEGYSVGYYLVSAMALVMLSALITGLVIYKRFWRALLRPQVRWRKGGRTLLGDLHRTAGVWSLWFLLLMSATGLWYLTQAIFWHNEIEIAPEPAVVAASAVPYSRADTPPQAPVDLDTAVQRAAEMFPGFTPSLVRLPEHNRDPIHVSGAGDSILFDRYSYAVAVNPWDGELLQRRSPQQMGGLETLGHIADPLHYGTIGGVWTKAIWFVFGLLLTGMCVMGFMIWWQRTRQGSRSPAESSVASRRTLIAEGDA